jgi:hypothetical protein
MDTSSIFYRQNHFALYPHPENQAIFKQVVTAIGVSVYSRSNFLRPELGVIYWDWSLQPVKSRKGM